MRDARLADAVRINAIRVRSWRATYRGHLPDALLDALDAKRRDRDLVRDLAEDNPRRAFVVAEGGRGPVKKVVGFAGLWEADDGSLGGVDGSGDDVARLYMIYVDPDWLGHGYGRALHDEVVARAAALGYRRALLWVLPSNERARRFYEGRGWTCEGTERTEDFLGFAVPEIRYVRDV